MEIIADLHIHSRYSRACSSQITIPNLEKWGRIKGVGLLGTGDFSHPEWLKELKEYLIEDETGILRTRHGYPFVLQNEISLMYAQGSKGRRIHLVLLAPDFATVDRINANLIKIGRLDYDGRPIFGMDCRSMTRMLKAINDKIEVIPAHVWTPWFGLFGSKSGFDSVEEAFGDQARHIYALETGLSSDPPMNWRLSSLDRYQLVSNSDSHSFWPWRLAREANLFELNELTYTNLIKAIRTGDGLKLTIEVDPAYGKYHFDGHRNCGLSMSPSESVKLKNICPVCKKPLTIGVLHRVEELADRPEGFKPPRAHPFIRIMPLHELISRVNHTSINSKKVWEIYNRLIEGMNNEYYILLKATKEEIARFSNEQLAAAIADDRIGKIEVVPGYDGVYGVPKLGQATPPATKTGKSNQRGLGEFL